MTLNIPFFPNTGDGTHCWQAALMMALKTFEPDRSYSYEELDRISAKVEGKWTWPTAAMIWLLQRDYELRLIEDFDYRDFADRGEGYILEKCGEEVGRAQMLNSNIEQEIGFARQFIDLAPIDKRLPTRKDFVTLLKEGFVIIANLNAAILYGQPGYSGHFVVVCQVEKDGVILHDPGLPPKPALRVSWEMFEAALAYPTKREKNLLAIRKKIQ